jgi:signal transduction histidine kinase
VKARLAAAGLGHGAAAAAVAAVVVTAAPAAAVGLAGQPAAQSVVMAVLVCLLLAVTGQFIRLGRESRDRTRLLLAQLQDARETEAAAAAAAERSRVAGELDDGLAHSLAGLAIQLQGARKLAGREAVSEALRAAIDRSAELAQAGLTDARQAVSALRGGQLPALAQLGARVEDRPRPSGTPASTAWGPRFSDTAPPAAGECS